MPNEQGLVEEVRRMMCEDCSEGPERYGYQEDLDMPACEGECEDLCRERARKIIERVKGE